MLKRLIALAFLATAATTLSARASERRFTYTYETAVLEPGSAEIEPWTTFRAGRERYYSRVDSRLEFELGLTERLQTALYWNFKAVAADEADDAGTVARQRSFDFTGVSSEWKYKLSDPVADPIGSALYLEGTIGPAEAGVELKLLFDKQVDRWLFAGNLVGEYEWEFEGPGETEREIELVVPLGVAYFITPSFTAGLEVRPVAVLEDGELESVALFAGPALSAAYDRWWLSMTILPQIYSPENEAGESLDLDHQEYFQTRLLLGFHLD